jgi:hypothetical protein
VFGFRALPRTLAAATRDLQDPKVQVRRSAIRDLVRLAAGEQREDAIRVLAEGLEKHSDPDTRADVAMAIADTEAVEYIGLLVDATYERHPRLRQMALLGLGELADPGNAKVERVVVQALTAQEPALRFQALLAMARLGVTDLAHRLETALGDGDPPVRYLALRLLDEHWERCQGRASVQRRTAAALRDPELQVRVAAALLPLPAPPDPEHLEQIGAVLVEGLEARVKLPAPEDEQALIERAGEMNLTAALPSLRRIAWGLFGVSTSPFAYQAQVALLRMGDSVALQRFAKSLVSRRRDVCARAVAAVAEARVTALGPQLEVAARSGRVDPELIERARAALLQASDE